METQELKKKGGRGWIIGILIVIIVILIGVSGYFGYKAMVMKGDDAWRAVFLTNGQVYFGKLKQSGFENVELTNVYYLQLQKPLQSGEEGATQENQKADISLVKLGKELHGPEDKMVINKDHVLFVEKLKDDSKVVEAIKNYK
jgi:uncharacterized protein YpmB